jgi:hypothetical protein
LPNWLSFNVQTHRFSGEPSTSDRANLTIRLTATDQYGMQADQTFNLSVVRFPQVNPLPPHILRDQRNFSWTLPNTTFTPGDGGALSYWALQENGQPLPGWLRFDNRTLTFAGKPDTSFSASALRIMIYARDGLGATVSVPLDWQVQPNSAPKAKTVSLPQQKATIDALFSYYITDTFSDSDDDNLTYSARQSNGQPLPGWLLFNASTQHLNGIPARSDAALWGRREWMVKLTAQDEDGLEAATDLSLVLEGDSYVGLFLKYGLPVLSALLTTFTYLVVRKNIYLHRRSYDLAYYLGLPQR